MIDIRHLQGPLTVHQQERVDRHNEQWADRPASDHASFGDHIVVWELQRLWFGADRSPYAEEYVNEALWFDAGLHRRYLAELS